jgi:hypothetical protein
MLSCKSCKKMITKKDDINFLAFLGFRPDVFCNKCYSNMRSLSRRRFYFQKQSLNSRSYTTQLFTGTVAAVFVMMFAVVVAIIWSEYWLLLFLLLIIPYSFYWLVWKYAKKIENFAN